MKTIARVAPLVALVLTAGLALPSAAVAAGEFFTTTPCRVFDSRLPADAPVLAHNTPRLIQVGGVCGVPDNASAAAFNVTAVSPTSDGDLVLYAGNATAPGPPRPGAMPFKEDKNRAKVDIVSLSDGDADFKVDVNALATMDGGTGETVHVVLDVFGYFIDDDAPVAVDDTAEVDEDDPATTINVLANDTDTDGGPKLITVVQNPSAQGGTVLITNSGADLTYEPAENYCNDPPGTTLDTFTYTLNGGDTATVTVTVNCIDDDPTAVDDTATVAEDSSATTIDVLANDTDPDGGPAKTIASATDPANGTVAVAGDNLSLTYTPDAGYCNSVSGPPDTFDYTLSPGSDTATVSVTVTCDDDPPTAVDDTATVAEDSGPTLINVLANDTDTDGGPKTIASATDPTNGTVTVAGDNLSLSYTPDPNYCNSVSGPSATPDTFQYTLNGGSFTTVSVTVTCDDDAPTAVDDTATVAEDSGATLIDVLANDTDTDGGAKIITSATDPANGTVVVAGDNLSLTYQPDANYCNTPGGPNDTFDYTLNGGDTGTVTVTVTCANDGPFIDLDANDDKGTGGADFAVTFTEGDAAKLIEDPADATITDPDSTTLTEMQIVITNLLDEDDEVLDADVSAYPNITKNYNTSNPGTGILELTTVTPQPIADFQAVLRTVTYVNTDEDPDATPRVITFSTYDGEDDSNTPISTVTVVPVDDDPTAVADTATVGEDDPATLIDVLANDTDPDGGTKTIASATDPANGTVTIAGDNLSLSYTPDAEYCNSVSGPADTFQYTLNGGSFATVSVTVTCEDDAPTAVADTATVDEDSSNNVINVLANDTDPDGGTKTIASATDPANGTVTVAGDNLSLSYTPDPNYCNSVSGPADTFQYTLNGGSFATVSVTVTCIEDDPVAVADTATVTEDTSNNVINVLANDTDVDGGTKTITSATDPANGTVAVAGDNLSLSYTPDGNYCNSVSGPSATPDTFQYTLNGGSFTTVSVTVICVDDPPVAVDDTPQVNEDAASTNLNVQGNDTDIDSGPIAVLSVTDPANGTATVVSGNAHYAPDPNYCNSVSGPSATPDTFQYTLTPGNDTGLVSVTVICINDAPTVVNESFQVIGNTELRVDRTAGTTPHASETTAGASSYEGVLDNDSDVEGDTISVTGILGCVVADPSAPFDCTLGDGAVVHVEANGEFSYTPDAGDTNGGSFQYTVTDQPPGGGAIPVNGTVSFTFFEMVWYVDNSYTGPPTSNGTSIAPFNALNGDPDNINGAGGAGDADDADDYIFIDFGNGGTSGQSQGFTLESGQHMLGEFAGLSIPVNLNGNGSPTVLAGVPTLTACSGGPCRPMLDDTALAAPEGVAATNVIPVEIVGLNLAGFDGTLAECSIPNSPCNAIDWTVNGSFAGSGTLTIRDNVVRFADAEGVDITHGGTGAFATKLAFYDNNLTAIGSALETFENGTGVLTITAFHDNVVSGASAGAGLVVNTAVFDADTTTGGIQAVAGGTTAIGSSGNPIGGPGLTLTTVSGNLNFANTAGSPASAAAGDLDIYTDSGAALSVNGTAPGFTLNVTDNAGVLVANAGPAAVIVSATIDLELFLLTSAGSSTTGVSLSGVTGTFSAPSASSISSAAAEEFLVSSSSAAVTYNGTINDTSGNDAGISLTSNSGTISFTGDIDLSTGSSTAFNASGGGTISATHTGSTLATTSGTALNVSGTTIGASNLTFESISAGSSGNPANGIFLSNTGSSGQLIVRGDGSNTTLGGNSTGGTIMNTTGANGATSGIGVYVNNARATLRRMNIHDHPNYGIFGGGSTVFNLEYSTVNSTATAISTNGNSAVADDEEGSVAFEEWAGSGTIVSSIIGDGYSNNLRVLNTNGADLNRLTVSSSRFDLNGQTAGNDQLHLESRNSGTTLNFTLTGSTVKGARADWFNASANSSSTMDTVITGNTFTNISPDNHPATVANGNRILVTANATHTFEVANNTLKGSLGNALAITGAAAGAVMTGDITNNDIGDAAIANSGSTGAGCISVQSGAGADITVLVDGNDVRQYNNHGIIFTLGDQMGSAATINATVSNNTANTPGTLLTDFNGFHVNSGTVSTDNLTSCFNIFNNNFTSSGKGAVAPNNSDMRLRQRQGTTVQLPGYTGPARDNGDLDVAEVITYLRPAGSGGLKNNTFGTGNANSVSTGGGYVNSPGGAACPTP